MFEYARVVFQGLIASVCFLWPGLLVLAARRGGGWGAYPLAYRAPVAFLLSSVMLAGFEAAAGRLLSPRVAGLGAWGLVALVATLGVVRACRAGRTLFLDTGTWERRGLAVVGGLLLLWFGLMPLSPYPGQLTHHLGDTPGYCRVAANHAGGRGLKVDFFIGDYSRGHPVYLTDQPLLALVTAFQFRLFGARAPALETYGAIAGACLIYLLAYFAASAVRDRQRADWLCFLFVLVGLGLPAHFLLFGLGVITAPGALAFSTVVAWMVTRTGSRAWRLAVGGLGVVFMNLVRPEAALLAGLLVVSYAGQAVFFGDALSRRARRGVGVVCLAVLVLGWLMQPQILDRLPLKMRDLSLFYLTYNESAGRFQLTDHRWAEINRKISRAHFRPEAGACAAVSERIGAQIRAHPLGVALFLKDRFEQTAQKVFNAVIHPKVRFWPRLAPWLIVAALGACLMDAAHRAPIVAMTAFLLFLPVSNVAVGERHVLVVTPVLLALLARTWLSRREFHPGKLVVGLCCVFIGLNALSLANVRRDERNVRYVPILRDLRGIVRPGELVATSYPQLIAYELDCPTVGTTWLAENLYDIVRLWRPAVLLLDNARDGPPNYDILVKTLGLEVPGYRIVRHDKAQKYAILRAAQGDRPSGEVEKK